MPTPTPPGLLTLSRDALRALRASLHRDGGPAAAAHLQAAGYAGGGQLFAAFQARLRTASGGSAEALDLEAFERQASAFFRELGWGSLRIGGIGDQVATVDSDDWADADPASGLAFPGCHFTTGMFADFFGRVAAEPLAVLEVECRSTGAPRCRFLLGSAEVLGRVYEELGRGVGYEEALTASAGGEGSSAAGTPL